MSNILLGIFAFALLAAFVGWMIWFGRRMQREAAEEARRLSDAEFNHVSRSTGKGSPDTRLGLPDSHDERRGG